VVRFSDLYRRPMNLLARLFVDVHQPGQVLIAFRHTLLGGYADDLLLFEDRTQRLQLARMGTA
jgi:hypothetical protein